VSKTWTFYGVVLPERVPVSLPAPFAGKAFNATLGSDFTFRVVIHASQIIVDLTIDNDDVDVHSLRNLASSNAQILTDLIGYKAACCFNVDIRSAVCRENDDWYVFGIDIPVLVETRAGQPREIDVALLQAIAQNPAAQFVLEEFANAIRFPIGTGFYCYRAIEAMMQFMKVDEAENEAVAWSNLRAALRLERATIDEVKTHADMPRHGKPTGMTDAERVTVFKIADEIIRRFLIYLTSARKPLSASKFEMLAPAAKAK
jgi:hypothetical protein